MEPARRGDEPVEPIKRVYDNADRPLRALIVLRQGATQWLDRLANDRNWRLESVGIVFRRLPDVRGVAMQRLDHPVKLGRNVGQFGEVVTVGERSWVQPPLPDAEGRAAKTDTAATI